MIMLAYCLAYSTMGQLTVCVCVATSLFDGFRLFVFVVGSEGWSQQQ